MQPVVSTNIADSDSEDDDYVPPAHEQDSDESANEDDKDQVTTTPTTTVDTEEKKRKRDALWAEFQSSVSNIKSPEPTLTAPAKVVKIEKRYRFAGEDLLEVVEVPEDSPDAKKWPLWKDPNSDTTSATPPVQAEMPSSTEEIPKPHADATDEATVPGGPPITSEIQPTAVSSSAVSKRPGPRKPKTTLAAIPSTRSKKLTTLDKSAMDWRAHIQSEQEMGSSLKDELEANRRAGGFLEKVEFLKRVEERKEEHLDVKTSSSKRRKL